MSSAPAQTNTPSESTNAVPLPDQPERDHEQLLTQAILPNFAVIAICVYTALAILHAFLLVGTDRTIMVGLSTFTAFLAAAIWAYSRRQPEKVTHAATITALIIFLGFANSLAHVWVTKDIMHTTNMALVIIGTGYLLSDLRLFIPAVSGQLVISIAAMASIASGTEQDVTHYATMLFLALAVAVLLRQSRKAHAKLKSNVDTLRSLIPLCASCGKARDDKGYWSRVENYIRDNLDHDVTHSICPDCSMSLYGVDTNGSSKEATRRS